MLNRRAAIIGFASVLVMGMSPLVWGGAPQEVRISVKGMVCPA